jgi:hypothetical protein
MIKNEYKIFDDYSIIYYKNKENRLFEIIIDTEDLNKVLDLGYSIYCHKDRHGNDRYYPSITIYKGLDENGKPKNEVIALHTFLMNFPTGVIDHKNGDTLNNRKSNLIVTGQLQNIKNRHRLNSNNKSGYRNVCLIDGYWRIQLQINQVNTLFKEKFTDVDLAGKFAKDMRQKYYGEFSGNQ